jgi:hypothetical protein
MRPLLISFVFVSSAIFASGQLSIDPTEFANKKDLHNADVNLLWRTLGISGRIRQTAADGSQDTIRSFNCGPDDRCEAELLPPEWPLLEGDGYDVVVRVSPTYSNNDLSRFLVFHHQEVGWRLLDYLDSTSWDYSPPQVSVVHSGGKRWLVVRAWPHCGTGCSLDPTDWFELKDGKLKMVLTMPISGHQANENPGRQFETRFVRASQSEAGETLEFVYHVEFSSGFGSSIEGDLWGDEKVIRFSRPDGEGEFNFDPGKSEASEAFVRDIFSASEVGQPQLFDLVQDHLLEIARGPNDRRREWLKEVLEQNPDLAELARVRAAFAKAP